VVDADEEYAIGDNDQATKVVVTKALNKQEQGDGNFGNVSLK
jgi:hypothetical protein